MSTPQENKMGVMPVPKLLVTMSLPIMISMLIQALYNIVDSIFVAQISDNALTAVSLAFPVQMLIIAISVGAGVGMNSLLSRKLGERDFDTVNKTAVNGIFIAVICSIFFAIFGLFFTDGFFKLFTDDPEMIKLGSDYLSIVCIFSFGCFIQIMTERILQATGNTVYNMIVQGIGAILNIILDPILIFGYFGFPKMGIAGAAVATVFGQIVAMCIGLWINHVKNDSVHMHYRGFRPDKAIVKEICKVGVPSAIMQSIGSVMTMGLNSILMLFSPVSVWVLGVYFKLQSFIFMPVFGLTNGLIPIIAFNYGAQNKKRIIAAVKVAMLLAVSIMAVGTLVFQLFPAQLLGMFNPTSEALSVGVPALRMISSCFILAAVGIVFSSTFQALGNGVYSLTVSIIRQLVIILPAAYVIARFFGIGPVWLSFPLAEAVACCISVYLFKCIYSYKIKYIGAGGNQL